jgi:Zn-dependent protease
MIGWASAPYDPHWQERYPRRAACMAAAGPAANFLLVLLTALAMYAGISYGLFELSGRASFDMLVVSADTQGRSGLSVFLSILFSLNVLLGMFNILPIPPLDGATIIGLLFDEDTARKIYAAGRSPTFQLIGILLAWQVFGAVFWPVFVRVVGLLYSF